DGQATRCLAHVSENSVRADAGAGPRAGPEARDVPGEGLVPEIVLRAVLSGGVAAPAESCTRGGSYWTGDTAKPILLRDPADRGAGVRTVIVGGNYPSLAVVRVPISRRAGGAFVLASLRRDYFTLEDILTFETVGQTLGVAFAHQRAQWALRERVKELTCLYGIAAVAGRPRVALDDCLREIAALLPPAWQYPEITAARITLDGREYLTHGFTDAPDRLSARIVVNGAERGAVDVVYTRSAPGKDHDPFLDEERSLITEVGRRVSLIVERSEADLEAARLQEQLRHAERLATVGQLSAGVAHELNEPLAAVLGFAELVKAAPDLPGAAADDVDRIIKAALHAREIIRKLMIFTRQMPTTKVACDLNQIIREGLYFLESRCRTQGIEVKRHLEEDLPLVMADPSQIQQALVNLVVNAIQAMPAGGALKVDTRSEADRVVFAVEDTGPGMTPDVQRKLFTPFFTTKDVGQGTGLGLAVVHGIVTAHGGTVDVRSGVGTGSTFEIAIPIGRSAPAGPVEAR
ncbi:MAG: hypothetical protein EHM24_32245, partial [Acidobacteria bacterium]